MQANDTDPMNAVPDHRNAFTDCPPLDWLESHDSFTYEGDPSQRVTMTKEERRGKRRYWIAYAKINGRKVSNYVGTSDKVAGKLADLPDLLASKA